jgi:glucose/arabinose dehydrogenase
MNRFAPLLALAAAATLAACGGQSTDQTAQQQNPPTQAPPAAQPTDQAPPPAPTQQAQPPATQAPATQAPAKPAAAQAAAAKPRMITVPAGEELLLAVDTPLDSGTAQVGDSFAATIVQAVVVDNKVAIPEGATVHGSVTRVKAAKQGAGNAELEVTVDQLALPGGYKTKIAGTLQKLSESQKGRNAAIIGGSAAGGALLGRILGKDTKGAVIGSVVAGGIGTAVVMSKEGKQAKIKADAPFAITLQEAVTVPQSPATS